MQQPPAAPAPPPIPMHLTKDKKGKVTVIPPHQRSNWGEVNQHHPFTIPPFVGTPGPTGVGEERGTRLQMNTLDADKKTALFFVRKFIDNSMIERLVEQTNSYVEKMATSEDPPPGYTLKRKMVWPPRWLEKWEPMTEGRLWRWIAMLAWMGLEKSGSERELWSTNWMLHRPCLSLRFFTRDQHVMIKNAIHAQEDGEEAGKTDLEGRPMLKKIGILLEQARKNWRMHWVPHPDIAYDEITLPMSGRSTIKRNLRGKKIGAGIQFLGMAESTVFGQYLYDAILDRNTGEDGKIQQMLIEAVRTLPPQCRGYRIAADNLFNSPATCKKVKALGHGIYGTLRKGRGIPIPLMDSTKEFTRKGHWSFIQSVEDNLTMVAWKDSGLVYSISNIHPPATTIIRRRTKQLAEPEQICAPVQLAEYNMWMGAIDDIDQLLAFLSCRLKSRKWWHAILWFIIDIALINALHLWRWANPKAAAKTKRREFVQMFIEEVLEKWGDRQDELEREMGGDGGAGGGGGGGEDCQLESTGGKGGSHKGLRRAADVVNDYARLQERHFAEKREKGNCALCYMTERTQRQVLWWCPQCRVHLHTPECFNEWHKKKHPKSPLV